MKFPRLTLLALSGCLAAPAFAFNAGAQKWGGLTVPMHLQLGAVNGTLIDGATSWDTVAEEALGLWNASLTNLKFTAVRNSTASLSDENGINNVFFAGSVYGTAWDNRTLGITLLKFDPGTNRYSEADVLFNATVTWNSYRGPLRTASPGVNLNDFRRVALHEFGHALGLNHPDDIKQNVSAVMNSVSSDVDTVTADDAAGARAIYDAPGSLASFMTIGGSTGYSLLSPNLSMTAGTIANEGNVTSGSLRLELWAMPGPLSNGTPPAGSHRLGTHAFQTGLEPGASLSSVSATTVYNPPPGGTYSVALLLTEFAGASSGFVIRDSISFGGSLTASSAPLPTVSTQPQSTSPGAGEAITFTTASPGSAIRWLQNGNALTGGTSASLTLSNLQSSSTGVYQAVVTNSAGSTNSDFAQLALTSSAKVIGDGSEVGTNILHPNGNTFDQVLLQGAAATVKPDAGQVLRISFVDTDDDIVQVEFAGAGTLSLVLDGATGPAVPLKYNQAVTYMKGHAGIVVTGADETTNLSVFSVGRGNAVNQALFKSDVTYDGFADIAFIAITSANGKFGGIRTANTTFASSKTLVGIYAPGVEFTGPVFVGEIDASQSATPALVLGSGLDVRVTGGDLLQTNGRSVIVNGIAQLKFVQGSSSHSTLVAAQPNKAVLVRNGVDVTSQIVVNP